MAHHHIKRGVHSHITAVQALIANGWEVGEVREAEVYDIIAKPPGTDPTSRDWKQIQIKTARIRHDRDGAVVVNGSRSDGRPYTPAEIDYMIGVLPDGDVYMFECRGMSEYWATPRSISKWQKLDTKFRKY